MIKFEGIKTLKIKYFVFFIQFSEKSDVWAFGVLVWECFSSGALPYGAHEFSEVLPKLRGNSEHAPERLECPKQCPSLL